MNNEYTIYVHINNINKKIYIGQTKQKVKNRQRDGAGYKSSSYFYAAIQKYGQNNFKHIVLFEHLSLEEANIIEDELIKKFNSNNKQYEYNLNTGGKNYTVAESTRQKHSLKQKKPIDHHTQETKDKISNSLIQNYKEHPELIEKKRQYMLLNNPMQNKKHSEETKRKMSLNKRTNKQVICLNNNMIFHSVREAARQCGLKSHAGIILVCNNKQNSAGKDPNTKEKLKQKYYG